MKRLTIIIDGSTMFDGDITEFQWNETSTTVAAKGTLPRQPGSGGGKAILDALAAAAKPRQPAEVEPKPDDG